MQNLEQVAVQNETFIKGKDSSLESSIRLMEDRLQSAGFAVQKAQERNPATGVFSVHLNQATCPGIFSNGKGASEKACWASGLGEFIERLTTNYFFSDFYLGNRENSEDWLYYPNEKQLALEDFRECLTPELWALYDPENEWDAESLLSFNDDADFIRAIEMLESGTGNKVYFPMNLFSNLYASNGLSAGNTLEEAKVQGLSEIFERWVKNQIFINNYGLPDVPAEVLENYPKLLTSIKAIEKHGFELQIKDASLGGKYPVVGLNLFDKEKGSCVTSFGAHPIFEVALERTITEVLQGKELDLIEGLSVPSFDELSITSPDNLENHFIDSSGLIHAKFISNEADFEFAAWDFSGTTSEQLAWLESLVYELDFKIYSATYNHYGLVACRTVVPGMSEVYPFDELLLKNQNEGRKLRDALMAFAATKDAQALMDELDYLGLSDHQGVASLIGLMPDAGSIWASLKVIDLQFWASVANLDWDLAREYLDMCLIYVAENSPLALVYRAWDFVLEMLDNEAEWKAYEAGMQRLFGVGVVQKIKAHLQGEEVFWSLDLADIFGSSRSHQELLRLYALAREAKAQASY